MDELKIISPGTEVWIGHEQDRVKGLVLEVCIKQEGIVQYRVVWWASRERKEAWMESFEIWNFTNFQTQKIGFA